jgi:hypothetical protein
MIGVLGVCAVALVWRRYGQPGPATTPADLNRLASQLAALEAREQEIARTVWAKELVAQQCGTAFEQLWDSLNAATDKFKVLGAVAFDELVPGVWERRSPLPHGLQRWESAGPGAPWNAVAWQRHLEQARAAGWTLGPVEFRHNRFELDAQGRPLRSAYYLAAYLVNGRESRRATVQGELIVEWQPDRTEETPPGLRRLDASQLVITAMSGPPAFEPLLNQAVQPPAKSSFIDPLVLRDLDGDGLPEIVLAASNLVFRRGVAARLVPSGLCRHPPGLLLTAVMEDFDGDGAVDLLGATFEGLQLCRGSPHGTFDQPAESVWRAEPRLRYGQVLTCGDVDGDGDLDVWLGQYKSPFERGQMPTPYYDANDGYPSWLLLNDGRGRFADATAAAGLTAKRWRRTYSASLVDWDRDQDLDLLVVSDFAGVDFYTNDGRGHFTDLTRQRFPESRGFGMAHTFADFNRDGYVDLLVMGMHCPTALRLDYLKLARPGREDYAATRAAMTSGNRLLLGGPGGVFGSTASNGAIARSGWSWGCAAFDADNDGYPDVYIANGHETRASVREYEPEFWLHDIYVGDSRDDVVKTAYFGAKFARTRGRGHSYGGYEKNRLYLNQQGTSFFECGHLFGLALESDCRNVVAGDLDGDGRQDLCVTTFEVWPKQRQTLQVFRNTLARAGNWIGFRLRGAPGASPVGARVTVRHAQGQTTQQIVTGDSHRAQHAPTLHFGLGSVERVEEVRIRWPNGQDALLVRPPINRYHTLEPTAASPPAAASAGQAR